MNDGSTPPGALWVRSSGLLSMSPSSSSSCAEPTPPCVPSRRLKTLGRLPRGLDDALALVAVDILRQLF